MRMKNPFRSLTRSTGALAAALIAFQGAIALIGSPSGIDLIKRACAANGAAASGCIISSPYSSQGGFKAATNLDAVGPVNEKGSTLYLETFPAPLDLDAIVLQEDQVVKVSFLYEGATTPMAFGYFELAQAQRCLNISDAAIKQIGSGIGAYKDGISFRNLLMAHRDCLERGEEGFIKFLFPDMTDDSSVDGILDWVQDKDAWCLMGSDSLFDINDPSVATASNYNVFSHVVFGSFELDNAPGGPTLNSLGTPCSSPTDSNVNRYISGSGYLPDRGVAGGSNAQPGFNIMEQTLTDAQEESLARDAGFDVNGDGRLTGRDSRISLGEVEKGSELIFFLMQNREIDKTYYTKATQDSSQTFGGLLDGWDYLPHSSGITEVLNDVRECPTSSVFGTCSVSKVFKGSSSTNCSSTAFPYAGEPLRAKIKFQLDDTLEPSHGYPLEDPPSSGGFKGRECDGFDTTFNFGSKSPPSRNDLMTISMGLIPASARSRMASIFGVNFTGERETPILSNKKRWRHFVLIPPNDPNKWMLGVENLYAGGDTDFNDVILLIQRETEGEIGLKQSKGLTPNAPGSSDAFFVSATLKVTDVLCQGSKIDYFLTPNGDASPTPWIQVKNWDKITDENGNSINPGAWVPGSPEKTTREAKIIFGSTTGRKLLWKAAFKSTDEACQPILETLDLDYKAATNELFRRSTAVPYGNVLYETFYETPATDWFEYTTRGHVKSTVLYDPVTLSRPTSSVENWDTADNLIYPVGSNPGRRTIFTSAVDVQQIADYDLVDFPRGEALPLPQPLKLGAGSQSATSQNKSVDIRLGRFYVPYSLRLIVSVPATSSGDLPITEVFTQTSASSLSSDEGGSALFDSSTGEIFDLDPSLTTTIAAAGAKRLPAGARIEVAYSLYTFNKDRYIDLQNEIGLTIGPRELNLVNPFSDPKIAEEIDINNDRLSKGGASGDINDARALKAWVETRLRPGAQVPFGRSSDSYALAAIDRSSPLLFGAPGFPQWAFGSAVTKNLFHSYARFICDNLVASLRPTKLYVGDTLGQLHQINAGNFRFYHVKGTPSCALGQEEDFISTLNQYKNAQGDFIHPANPAMGLMGDININEGYYGWPSEYGSGAEEWAYIPPNQLFKLKNNFYGAADPAAINSSASGAVVRIGSEWRYVLVSTEGQGGNNVFALDVTDVGPNEKPKVLWIKTDKDLNRSIASPVIVRTLYNNKPSWRMMLASAQTGYGARPKAKMFYAELTDEADKSKPNLDAIEFQKESSTPLAPGEAFNAVDQPVALDSDGNGFIDVLYFAVSSGEMRKMLYSESRGTFTICQRDFLPATLSLDPAEGIYAPPTVVTREIAGASHPVVFFGTSDDPESDNFSNNSPSQRFHIVSVYDPDPTSCAVGTLNWVKQLPTGHRIFASPSVIGSQVIFGSSTGDTTDPCAASQSRGGEKGGVFIADLLDDDDPIEAVYENVGNFSSPISIAGGKPIFATTQANSSYTTRGDFAPISNLARIGAAEWGNWREIDQ